MRLSAVWGVGLMMGALCTVGHGTVVSDWDGLLTLHRPQRRVVRADSAIASAAARARRHLLAGRRHELEKVLTAARLRRAENVAVASAEASYWAGDAGRGALPSNISSAYLAVLTVSNALRFRMPIPAALWSSIATAADLGDVLGMGASHGARLASVVAAVNPTAGRDLARQQLREHTRRGDVTGAARALLLLGVLATRSGHRIRAHALTARAAHRAALNSDGGTVYAALAQLADVASGRDMAAEDLCMVVPLERERLHGDCLSAQAARLWGEGRIRAAVSSFHAARIAGSGFGPWWDMDFARRTTPLLLGLGRWDEFDAIVSAGIEAAAQGGHAEVEAELWLRAALSARARGYHATAARAVGKSRLLARAPETRIAVEVAAARLALVRGATDQALRAYESALEIAQNGPRMPFDAYMVAADLAVTAPVVRTGQRSDMAAAGLSLLPGLLTTLLALDRNPLSEQVTVAFSEAARRVSKWADAAGRSDQIGALAAAHSVWTRLARVLLATGRPVEALLAVERSRAGLREPEQLTALRRDLSPGTGVLVFADLSNELWWWAVDADGVVAGRVAATSAEIRGRSAVYARRLRARDRRGVDVIGAGQALSTRVLGPVLSKSGWGRDLRRIVVVPAAGLGGVPIDTLPLPGDPVRAMGDRYLLTRVTSLRDLHRAMTSRAQSSLRVGFVPRVGRDAQSEARVVRLMGARVFVGPSATRATFLRLASGAELVHFGGHALAANMPGGAAMSFAGTSWANRALMASEVAQLELQGATVVLLGCDTGAAATSEMGVETRGRSLAEAFVRAGARGVAATLWPIDDASAREIASALYAGGQKLPTAASLSAAKIVLRRKYPNEPYRWAGFVWYGPPVTAG